MDKKFSKYTGFTEPYASRILKNENYATWSIPGGASKEVIRTELISEITGDTEPSQDARTSEELFFELLANGGEITLENDVELVTNYATIKKNTVINLNGHNIIAKTRLNKNNESTAFGIVVNTGAELTINGNGNVVCEEAINSNVVWAYGGKITINGGRFENKGPVNDVIYASKTGQIEINGGEFVAGRNDGSMPAAKNEYNVINKLDADRDKCSIFVKGGKYFGFDPGNNLSEGPNTNFLAEGYVSVKNGDWYEVEKAEEPVTQENGDETGGSVVVE